MKIAQTSQFKWDIKKQKKRGKDLSKLQNLIEDIVKGKNLEEKYLDHPLKGKWVGRRDSHVEPDWIVIYRITDEELRL